MAVRRLVLSNFRNHAATRLDVEPGVILLTGENGAGKTNLLEAVSLLAPGRGLRRAKVMEMERAEGKGPWAVSATLNTAFGPIDVGTGRDPMGDRRLIRINGALGKSQAVLGEYVSAVWLTPAMDRLFAEGASARRRFLDRLICGFDPAHAGRVAAHDKAMRERMAVLQQDKPDEIWLSVLETGMAERGVAIAAARRDMAARLNAACQKANGPFPKAKLQMEGPTEFRLEHEPALAVESWAAAMLKQGRAADADNGGGAAVGPHQSDLAVIHLDRHQPAHLCSTGEQKALLVAIVLAHAALQEAERGTPPLLLLDEVAAHLDVSRRAALFDRLADTHGQVWLTGTDRETFSALEGRFRAFHVQEGTVQRL